MTQDEVRAAVTKDVWAEDFNKFFSTYILQSPDIEMVKRAITALENPTYDLCFDIYKRLLKYCKCKIYYDGLYRLQMGKIKLVIVKPIDICVWEDQYIDQIIWDLKVCPLVISVDSAYEGDFASQNPHLYTCIRWEF